VVQSEPKRAATRDSWKTLPLPSQREDLRFAESYSATEFEAIKQGLVPVEMEDKWFIFSEDGWLYFHRSWTGAAIYGIRFESTEDGASPVESWTNRDSSQYQESRTAYDRAIAKFLIDAFLLRKPASFPIPPDVPSNLPDGAFQHHMVGRAYTEVTVAVSKAAETSWLGRIWNFIRRLGK
jgi:hypothetical protein